MSVLNRKLDPKVIPIIGEDIYQVGQVIGILDQACVPNPVIAVEGFFSYLPTLVWSIAKPDAIDMTLDRAGRRHKRRRYRKFKKKYVDQGLIHPQSQFQRAVFRIGQAAQKVGFFLIIVDAGTDFAVNWATMAYQWSGCNVINPNWAQNWGNSPLYVEPFIQQPWNVLVTEHDDAGYGIASGNEVRLQQTGPFSLTYSAQPDIQPYQGRTGVVTDFWLDVEIGSFIYKRVNLEQKEKPDGTKVWQGAYQDLFAEPKMVVVHPQIEWSDGYLAILDQTLTLDGAPSDSLLSDP